MSNYNSLEDLLKALGARESSGNYLAVNYAGYLGKYQMGSGALEDAGYYKANPNSKNNDWSGKFLGKDNVYSKDDFLKNPQAQEQAIREYMKKQWGYLKSNKATKAVGSKINGIEITPSGLLGGAHLVGHGEAGKYVHSNGRYIPKDGNGTSVEEYLKKFAGYDVSEIIDPNYYTSQFGVDKDTAVSNVLNQGKNVVSGVANKVFQQSPIPSSVVNKTKI